MFKRAPTTNERVKFSMRSEQIKEDIEAVYKNSTERNKLYYCLDDTPPQDPNFQRIEEFLSGPKDMDKKIKQLELLNQQLQKAQQELLERMDEIKTII